MPQLPQIRPVSIAICIVGFADGSSAKVTWKSIASGFIHTEVNEHWSAYSNKPVFIVSKLRFA